MSETRFRPRSLKRYPETMVNLARKLFLEYAFIKEENENMKPAIARVMAGDLDDMPMLQLAGFVASKQEEKRAGVRCVNCGSSWSDERLSQEKQDRKKKGLPDLISCCPERKMKPVYWCLHD